MALDGQDKFHMYIFLYIVVTILKLVVVRTLAEDWEYPGSNSHSTIKFRE